MIKFPKYYNKSHKEKMEINEFEKIRNVFQVRNMNSVTTRVSRYL